MTSHPSNEVHVVLSTFASREDAVRVGRELVERRLAACMNVVPGVESIYRWEGKVEDAAEVLAIMKTRGERLQELMTVLAELHPYAVPEILSFPAAAAAAYGAWVAAET